MTAIAKNTLLLALIYCLLAPVLFGVEKLLLGAEAYLQVLPICCLSVFFFVSTVGIMILLSRALRRNRHFENLYLLMTMLLSFACIVVFILYAVLYGEGLLTFTVNMCAFYVVSLVYLVVCSILQGRKKKREQC